MFQHDRPAALIRELKATIQLLDAALLAAGVPRRPAVAAWALQLTPQQRSLMGALLGAYPRPITRDCLLGLIPSPNGNEEERQLGLVSVLATGIRKKLGKFAVVNAGYGEGLTVGKEFFDSIEHVSLDLAA